MIYIAVLFFGLVSAGGFHRQPLRQPLRQPQRAPLQVSPPVTSYQPRVFLPPPVPRPQPIPAANDCQHRPGPWSACSAPCGGGIRTRQQIIVQQQSGYGAKCPDLAPETENCNTQPCPIDCEVEPGQYGPCSASCGTGQQTKIDIIIRQAQHGGRQCPPESSLKTTIQCPSLPPCPVPVDCVIGYTEYSLCSAPCGGGFQTRTAFVVTQAANGGAPCPPDMSVLSDSRPCNEDIPCTEPKDCEYILGEFGQCSAPCGSGVQKQQLYVIAQPENGGLACPSSLELFNTRPCQGPPCPVPTDCQVQWQPFDYCTRTCGGGTQTAQGRIIREATAGGAPCPSYAQLTVTRTCNNNPCVPFTPRDCEVVYGPFSECSATCGYGSRYQKGYIKVEAENGGLPCPSLAQLTIVEPCNLPPCLAPVDCRIQRGYFSECSQECGGGTQTRTLTILEYASNGGHPCPSSLTETRPCNTEPCQRAPPAYGQPQPAPQPRPQPRPRAPPAVSRPAPRPGYGRRPAAPQLAPRRFNNRRLAPAAPAPRAPATGTTFRFGGYGQ